jgi:hypothetical protein
VNGKKIKVMGQTVSANATQLAGMKIGQWVNVSGLRKDDGSVLASRIDLTSEQKTVQTVGNLTRRGNRLYLNGTLVEGISKSLTNSGNDIRITGMWDGKALNVKDMTLGPVSDLLQKIETFHIQGFANDAPNKGRMKVDGQSVVVTEKTKMIGNSTAKNVSGNVVIIRGQMSSGKPNVQSIELKPLKTENRQQLDSRARPLSKKMTDGPSEKSSSNDTNEVKVVKSEKDKRAERTEKTADTEKAKHIKVTDKAERAEKAERPEGVEKVERPESVERVERPEGVEKVERPEGVERVERHEGVERVERHEGVERVERHERH